MKLPVPLLPDERVIFTSARGGPAHHRGWWWLAAVLGGLHVGNVPLNFAYYLAFRGDADGPRGGFPFFSAVEGVFAVVLLVRWLDLRSRPTYFLTSRRLVARRILQPPQVVALSEITAAVRFLIKYYGRINREVLTHTVVIGLRSGASHRVGPVGDVADFVDIVTGVVAGEIDPAALPPLSGELAAGETRRDLFFAATSRAGDEERGPLLVGPGVMIRFPNPLPDHHLRRIYSIVGAAQPAEEVEAQIIALAERLAFEFGRAAVRPREGTTLSLDKHRFVLTTGAKRVVFDLHARDLGRAADWLAQSRPHPYR